MEGGCDIGEQLFQQLGRWGDADFGNVFLEEGL
jgi:hypothetical protein